MTKIQKLAAAVVTDYAEVSRLDEAGDAFAADKLQRAANRRLPKMVAIRSSLPADWQAKARVLRVLGGEHDSLRASLMDDLTAAAA